MFQTVLPVTVKVTKFKKVENNVMLEVPIELDMNLTDFSDIHSTLYEQIKPAYHSEFCGMKNLVWGQKLGRVNIEFAPTRDVLEREWDDDKERAKLVTDIEDVELDAKLKVERRKTSKEHQKIVVVATFKMAKNSHNRTFAANYGFVPSFCRITRSQRTLLDNADDKVAKKTAGAVNSVQPLTDEEFHSAQVVQGIIQALQETMPHKNIHDAETLAAHLSEFGSDKSLRKHVRSAIDNSAYASGRIPIEKTIYTVSVERLTFKLLDTESGEVVHSLKWKDLMPTIQGLARKVDVDAR